MNKSFEFPAKFIKEDEGISIVFPDIKNCVSCAYSQSQTFDMAAELLEITLAGLLDEGIKIPQPTPIDKIKCAENETVYSIKCYADNYDFKFKNKEQLIDFLNDEIIDDVEAGEILNCTRQYINKLVSKGRLTPVKSSGKYTLFLRISIEELKNIQE